MLLTVPRDKLDKVVVQADTSLGVEDGGVVVSVQISGDEFILGVCKDSYVKDC